MREVIACPVVADFNASLFCYYFVVTFTICPFNRLVKIDGDAAVDLFNVIGAWSDYVLGRVVDGGVGYSIYARVFERRVAFAGIVDVGSAWCVGVS